MEKVKTKNSADGDESEGGGSGMSNALKFLLLAAGCGLVILLITVAVLTAKKGEDDTSSNLDQYSSMASEYEDVDLKVYDGGTATGSDIKKLIDEYAGKYMAIVVTNGKANTSNYINTPTINTSNIVTAMSTTGIATVATLPSAPNYINDAGTFLGDVLYDQNGIVVCLTFKQQ